GRGARLHPVLAPPRIGLGEPDRVEPRVVHRAGGGEHLVERLHRQLHHADAEGHGHPGTTYALSSCSAPTAFCTSVSSALSTCCTCWLTIGWMTRCPSDPPGPALFTSATHSINVPGPASLSSNEVCMFSIAPTPWPLICRAANSSSRCSTLSMSIFIFRPPRPSGILTFAVQRRSSWTSNDSTPGIVFASAAGSFKTFQTAPRGASNVRSPETFTRPSPSRALPPLPGCSASPTLGGTGSRCPPPWRHLAREPPPVPPRTRPP